MPKTDAGNRIIAAKAKPKLRSQTTVVQVAVTTAGPVSMKSVREHVGGLATFLVGFRIDGSLVTRVRVKRDADTERPRR